MTEKDAKRADNRRKKSKLLQQLIKGSSTTWLNEVIAVTHPDVLLDSKRKHIKAMAYDLLSNHFENE